MNYISVCSGIEAATVAWHPLGWRPLLFAEIADFPSRVLAHHYPETPNVGDFTSIPARSDCDLLVGGTPCQAFSIAGLRRGLDDARGNLALEFMRLADRVRPRWIVWENVPGVLSSNGGRDFGSILGALAELGYGFAYRVLDAQYFGVAQRRRRVFVVGHLGDWRPAAAVLFERESLRRDPPPRESARKGAPRSAARGARGSGVADTLTASGGRSRSRDALTLVTYQVTDGVAEEAASRARAAVLAPHPPVCMASGQANAAVMVNAAPALTCLHESPLVAFDPTQITNPNNRSTARGDTSPTLAKTARPPHIAQAVCITGEVTHALTSVGADASEDGTGRGTPITPVLAPCLDRSMADKWGGNQWVSQWAPVLNAQALAGWSVRRLTPRECERLQGFPDDYTEIPGAKDGPRYAALGNSMAVPVMRWIGERIAVVDRALSEAQR